MTASQTFTAFDHHRQIATGDLDAIADALCGLEGNGSPVVILADATGEPVELDLRHGPEAAAAEYRNRTEPPAPARQRGRPRLGVVAREVTLLPRHWDWLTAQPGGASAALRRLIDDARRSDGGAEDARRAQTALYRAMSVLAGDLPGFEEATRALYALDDPRFDGLIGAWPEDVVAYLTRLAAVERTARLSAA